MQYVNELKRLIKHPKKYPMYRITKLRYVFLHILLLSIILIIPNTIQYFQITQNISTLAHEEVDEIPKFKIHNNEMKLSEEKIIKLNDKHYIVINKSQQYKLKPTHKAELKQQD